MIFRFLVILSFSVILLTSLIFSTSSADSLTLREKLYTSNYQTFETSYHDRDYNLKYYLHSGNELEQIKHLPELQSIVINITLSNDVNSVFTIELPHELIQKPTHSCGFHDPFVIVDGEEVIHQFEDTDSVRVLEIPLLNDSHEIEILGTGFLESDMYQRDCQAKLIDGPLKRQLSLGMNNYEIKCSEHLQSVEKSSDGFPACVKPTSIPKLIERDWASNIIQKVHPCDDPNMRLSSVLKCN